MEKITVRLYGRKYTLFRFIAFEGTPKAREVTVAEFKLNSLIGKRILEDRYHEVKHVDEMYGYFLPKQIDLTDERGIRESIEDVIDD